MPEAIPPVQGNHPPARTEADSLGTLEIPAGAYWGAQTERARQHFAIGEQGFDGALIRAQARIKLAAARINGRLGELTPAQAEHIAQAAREVLAGRWQAQFPLSIFISGSGTQFNMNMNEVLANRAIELAGGTIGSKTPVHPNDHVNRGQSSNDTFPTAMHLAATQVLTDQTVPALAELRDALGEKAAAWDDVVKLGRTHLQDAVPMTLGQECSGWAAQLDGGLGRLGAAMDGLLALPIGGTAVGTGLNAPPGFAAAMVAELRELTGNPWREAPNRFEGLAAHDALAFVSGALRTVAGSLLKIANDIRWLGSGPQGGLGELRLPANEPGSSIMPGKVNPTQAEALTMVAAQVYGHDAAVAFAASQGNLELNVYKPVIIHNVLQAARLLADGCRSFRTYCVEGLAPEPARLAALVSRSAALVTALVPAIGYDKAAEIAHHAHAHGMTLRDAALALGHVSAAEYDRLVVPAHMAKPHG